MDKMTKKISGFFNVRRFDPSGTLPRESRAFIGEGETIQFAVVMTKEEFAFNGISPEFGKLYTPKNGDDEKIQVKFKISRSCKWFGADGKAIARPTNEELDGCRWNAVVSFVERPKTDQPLKPCGLWANAIMVEKVEQIDDRFANISFADYQPEGVAYPDNVAAPSVTPPTPTPINQQEDLDDMPF